MRKHCSTCGQRKPATEFYSSSHTQCKACHCAWQRDRYATSAERRSQARDHAAKKYNERRTLIDTLKSVPCFDCGNRFDPVCMDFDHRPGEVKLFCISNKIGSRTAEAIRTEAAKCDVVCANCHRLRTFKQRDHRIFRRKQLIGQEKESRQ